MSNVLAVIGEAETFTVASGTPGADVTSGRFDADFARCGIAASTADTFSKALSSLAVAWLGTTMFVTTSPTVASNTNVVNFLNHSSVVVARLIIDTSNQLIFQRWDGSAFQQVGVPFALPVAALTRLDFRIEVDASVGVCAWYVNGNLIGSPFTGDTSPLVDIASIVWRGVVATKTTVWSEGVVMDGSTVGQRLATLGVNGNGTDQQWTGSYTDIDEVGDANDSDFIYTTAVNQVSTYALDNPSVAAASYNVTAVVVAARAKRSAAGPQNLQAAVRTHSTDYFSSNLPNITTSFAGENEGIWNLNPNTSAVWTQAELNALEAGVKSIT